MGVCIACISPDLKAILVQETGERRFADLPACPDGAAIGFTAAGRKRAASAYNRFIGECIRARPAGTPVPERMKSCAADWKRRKV